MTNEDRPDAVTDKRAAMSALLDEAIKRMCDLGAEPWEIIHRLRAAEISLRLKHWPVPGADPTKEDAYDEGRRADRAYWP
jgi:hypothetical protein